MANGRIEAGAVILAAGLSTRFGGHPKALATFGGRPLLEAAVENFRLCGLNRVTVVTGHGRLEVAALAASLGAEAIFNPDYQSGMFSSVQAGVRAMTAGEAFFVLPVDGALVQPHTVLSLLTAWGELGRGRKEATVLTPVYKGRTGHPPLIGSQHRDSILNWPGPGGLRGWLASLMTETIGRKFLADGRPAAEAGPIIFLDWPDEGVICDLDTPEELAAARPPRGRDRPTPAEAWQLLRQLGLKPVKIRHSWLVAGSALGLVEGLVAAGLEADPQLAFLAGLLHDTRHDEKKHARAGRLLCTAMGWPGLALAVGAHTDPPPAALNILGESTARDGQDYGEDNQAYLRISPSLSRVALAVYLADKYWWDDNPVSLADRFQTTRDFFRQTPKAHQPEALAAVDRRERVALAVEDWFRGLLGREPEDLARQAGIGQREGTRAGLAEGL